MYSRYKFSFLVSIFFIFLSTSKVFSAEAVTITSFPSSKNAGEEFNVNFSASGLINSSSYYMKGLGANTTTSSFTEIDTWNNGWVQQNGSWVSMPTFSANSEGSASATLKVRFDPNVSTNTKDFKVRIRKTDSETNIDSGIVAISITAVTPSPTQVPTAVPSASPVITSKPTSVPTAKPTVKPTPIATQVATDTPEPENTPIADIETEPEPTPTLETKVLGDSTSKKRLPIASYAFILIGLGFLGYVGYMLYNNNVNKHA